MVSKLKQRVADVVHPGWRRNKLVTSMLEHQERLRADPDRQALKRSIDRQSRKELGVALLVGNVAALCLLIGGVCWLGHVSPLTAIAFPVVQQLALAGSVGMLLTFLILAR